MIIEFSFTIDENKKPFFAAISELMALDIDRTLSEEKQVMVELLDNERRIAHYWVLREQLKGVRRNQHPYCEKQFKLLEPFGMWQNERLELCHAALNFVDEFSKYGLEKKFGLDYPNAADWWKLIEIENRENVLSEIDSAETAETKEEIKSLMAQDLLELKAKKNPYDPETKPHHYKLIEVSLWICDRQKSDSNAVKQARTLFINKRWKWFLDAFQRCVNKLHHSPEIRAMKIKNGKLYVIEGGKRDKLLYSPNNFSIKRTRQQKK